MKPAPFEYHAPTTLDGALALMTQHGWDGKPLAGGQSLIPTMNFRLAQPAVLIDLNNIPALSFIKAENDSLHIGAMTRQRQVERSAEVAQVAPLVAETMPFIAHPQIRNRGTFGGSLAHADPASELPAVALALGARFKAQSQNGSRWINANDFFVDLFTTALEPEELLTEIALPSMPPRTGYAFEEVSRRHGDYALVGAAATVTLNAQGQCEQARLVYFGVGPGPVQAHQAEALLVGQKLTPEAITAAAETAASQDIDPAGDIHASADFRRHLARVLAQRTLSKASERVNIKLLYSPSLNPSQREGGK